MPHSYASEYPDVPVLDGIPEFFQSFYQISDTADAHTKYLSYFTKDATFIIAAKRSNGHDEILATRTAMWSAVSARQHTALKIFPFGPNSSELMLYGTVTYTLKDGSQSSVDWAGRAKLVKDGEAWKFGFYQIYLDTGSQQNAK